VVAAAAPRVAPVLSDVARPPSQKKKNPPAAKAAKRSPERKPPKVAAKLPTEHAEQCEVIRWRDDHVHEHPCLAWLTACPNGQAKFSKYLQGFYKDEGLTSGVADLSLPEPRGKFHGLFIEMKRVKGGKVSDNQQAFIDFVRSRGYSVHVAAGAAEAIAVLENYLALPPFGK
jgi:hypothetical protein